MGWLNGITDSLDEHKFEQVPGFGDGRGSLACCSTWGHKELNTTEQLNQTELNPMNATFIREKRRRLGTETQRSHGPCEDRGRD